VEILNLACTPLANNLLKESELKKPEAVFPLQLVHCPKCSLLQITESVPPETLFSSYPYFSSFSDTMVSHAKNLAERLIKNENITSADLVLEIASNDGYLLQHYKSAGVEVLGVEPAKNIAEVAINDKGINTIVEFFNEELALSLAAQRKAKIIHAHNVLAHVPDLNGFVEGMKKLLRDDGLILVEVPYARPFLENCEFDTIYHEHLCYFSLTALDKLFKRHDLTVCNVKQVEIHGGTIQLEIRHAEHSTRSVAVESLLAEEDNWQVNNSEGVLYRDFKNKVQRIKLDLLLMLRQLKNNGNRIAAYGAAAKGSTLLNYFGIDKSLIDYVVDRSTYKQGFYMPGVHLPIYKPEHLLKDQPDYVLLLTWNFAEEILKQQKEYIRRGGKFIVPLPMPKII